ncbi:hypothetical protein [Mannheimia indoligenes]|uniref:hypothetical protein n=1 Tax=Mannheimia indoligenes TaxID=3103145 RepID=UPI002FE62FD3
MIWVFFVSICSAITLYSIYHKTSYLNENSYFIYYVIAFLFLCEIFYIWKWRRSPFLSQNSTLLGKKASLWNKIGAWLCAIIFPILFGDIFSNSFNVVYTKFFGTYEKPYKVDILEIDRKPYFSRRNTGYTHIYILREDQTREMLDVSTSFYKKITIEDQLLITKKISPFGYYIDEDEIIIIQNKL